MSIEETETQEMRGGIKTADVVTKSNPHYPFGFHSERFSWRSLDWPPG